MNVKGIARETLDFILKVSRSSHPNEFAGLLQVENGIIANIIILPTFSSDASAMMQMNALPVGLDYVGSVHSHPTHSNRPSETDLRMFSRKGDRHIIVCNPYDENSWACYDKKGKVIELEVLDVELEDSSW
jgi:proteasome lid subunit RPN8/RPN11